MELALELDLTNLITLMFSFIGVQCLIVKVLCSTYSLHARNLSFVVGVVFTAVVVVSNRIGGGDIISQLILTVLCAVSILGTAFIWD